MNKILLIIKREYITRVKKKSFIVMTILGPILLAGIMIVPVWLSMKKPEKQKIEVIDESMLLGNNIPNNEFLNFEYPPISLNEAKHGLYMTDYSCILYVPDNIISGGKGVTLFYKKQPGIATEQYVQKTIEKMLYDLKLQKNNINKDVIKSAETSISVLTIQQPASGKEKETNTGVNMFIGFGAGILIYMFIFLYGVQVMRGVMEEKTSRIVEVILSSVKPFQLMMGKIVGVALVGLTQFLLWVVLTMSIYSVASVTLLKNMDMKQVQQQEKMISMGANLDYQDMKSGAKSSEAMDLWKALKEIDFVSILLCFLFYFLGGYLLYSAMFAAVGSAVDNEADTQQFMLPITIPLVFSFVMAQTIIQDPEGSLSFWFSIIPLTSPIIMMVRLPFGVPAWELCLSMGLLIFGFIGTTWLAGKIYRTGILMYGKKVSYKELWKWLFYKG